MAIHQSKIYRALGGDMRKLDAFCAEMDAGRSAAELQAWVKAHTSALEAEIQLSDMNITDFRQGYFRKWRLRQEQLIAIRERAAAASQLVREARASGASITEAAEVAAASTIGEVLEDFSAADLRGMLAEKPEQFVSVVSALSRISSTQSARKALADRAAAAERSLAIAEAKWAAQKERIFEKLAKLEKLAEGGKLTGEQIRARIKEVYGA